MSKNIIRKDVVQIAVETDTAALDKLHRKVEKVESNIVSGVNSGLDGTVNAIKKVGKANGLENAAEDAAKLSDNADNAAENLDDAAKTNFSKLTNGLSTINDKLTTLAKKAAGAAFNGLKKFAALSFKTLIAGLGATATGIVTVSKLASDLEETKNKIDVAFGSGKGTFDGAATDVLNWSKKSSTSMGLAQQTALDTAALFGDMGTSMGFAKDEAAEMSMALTQQAADLASFKNMNIDSVTTALKGVFTGETESLKNLGVVMTTTNLEQYALTKGITKSYDAMTQAEKVQLRYNYVMEMTKNATGDYVRTGGGFANQLRTLTENFKQLGAAIGEMPMKTLASGMKVINDGLAKIQAILADGFQESDTEKIMKIVEGLIDKGITAISNGIPKILPMITRILSTIANSLVKEIPNIAPVLAKAVVQLMMSLGKVIVDNRQELVAAAKSVVTAVIQAVYEGFTGKALPTDAIENFSDKIVKLIPIIGGLAAAFLAFNKIKSVGSALSGILGKTSGKSGGDAGGKSGGLFNAFTSFANLKVTTVLKGMANLAIVLAGFAVLAVVLAKVAPIINKTMDIKELFTFIGVIAVLGSVGIVLTKFAGEIGKVSITTVLKGIANIGLVVAGMSALFLLIGAVSLLDFDYKRLITITAIIGVLGGVGGAIALFAGIVGAIPIPVVLLGLANIALVIAGMSAIVVAFGALSKIKGFNDFITKGGEVLANLFNALGNIMGSLIGGFGEGVTNSLPKIGKNLSAFAKSLSPMFSVFKNADMSGIGTFFGSIANFLIKVTGNNILDTLTSWFTKDNPFEKLGENLSTFAEKAKGFFTTAAGLPENGFANAIKMFDSVSNMSKLSKSTKKVDFSGIANGLGTLSKESIKNFFAMVSELKSQDFGNAKLLFDTLSGINDLPKKVDSTVNDIVDKVSKLPKKMGDALKSNSKNLSNGFVQMWKAAVKASVAPVNKLLSGANHILKEFGSNDRVIEWTPYARGTSGHKGGNALVNDGRGAELVQMPNGNTFIPKGRNVFIPNAPKGMKVLSANQTAHLMGKNSPTFSYKNGIGDIWSYYDNPEGLINKLRDGINYNNLNGFRLNLSESMVATFTNAMTAWVKKLFEKSRQSLSSYDSSKGVKQWLPTVVRALKMEHLYSSANVMRTLFQMRTESGGNPMAINLWDSNAKNGTPSKGLMQVIAPTFKAYAKPGFDENIYDPLSNVLASIRYATKRYGSLSKAYRGVGYANGGIATKPSIFGEDGIEMAIPLSADKRKRGLELWQQTGRILGASTYSPEKDYASYNQTNSTEYNNYSPQFVINVSGTNDDRVLARKIKRFVQEGINECFDSISRQSPKIREV